MEPTTDQLSEAEPSAELKPRGEIVIGSKDPRIMTSEEFNSNPELLFHGAAEEFVFSPNYDFSGLSNSWTIGRGFYATPDKESASEYSRIRQEDNGIKNPEPLVYPILPFEAHLFDFRSAENPARNAYVPKDIASEYYRYLRQEMGKMDHSQLLTNHVLRGSYNELRVVASNLAALIRNNSRIGLRHMMNGESEGSTIDRGSTRLADFMMGKGYDGVIYNEGGDRPDQTHTTSYVFYDLNKIGTYDSWHSSAA